MVNTSKITPFPVYLVQEIINIGSKNMWKGEKLYGQKYPETLYDIIKIQSRSTFDCFDKIFDVPDNQMVEVPDDFFEVLNI